MKKIKDLLDKFDQVQTIPTDDQKKMKGGFSGFVYNGIRVGYVCRFCSGDNDDQ